MLPAALATLSHAEEHNAINNQQARTKNKKTNRKNMLKPSVSCLHKHQCEEKINYISFICFTIFFILFFVFTRYLTHFQMWWTSAGRYYLVRPKCGKYFRIMTHHIFMHTYIDCLVNDMDMESETTANEHSVCVEWKLKTYRTRNKKQSRTKWGVMISIHLPCSQYARDVINSIPVHIINNVPACFSIIKYTIHHSARSICNT